MVQKVEILLLLFIYFVKLKRIINNEWIRKALLSWTIEDLQVVRPVLSSPEAGSHTHSSRRLWEEVMRLAPDTLTVKGSLCFPSRSPPSCPASHEPPEDQQRRTTLLKKHCGTFLHHILYIVVLLELYWLSSQWGAVSPVLVLCLCCGPEPPRRKSPLWGGPDLS